MNDIKKTEVEEENQNHKIENSELSSSAEESKDLNGIVMLSGKPIPMGYPPVSLYEGEKELDFSSYVRIVGVRFEDTGKVFNYFAKDLMLEVSEAVVVDASEYGLVFGWVVHRPFYVDNSKLNLKLRSLVRKANEQDFQAIQIQKKSEKVGLEKTQRAVERFGLPMDILKVEYTLDLRKVTVYFSSENRVDFRDLLKDLIRDLKARVELRQIGVRDQTRLIGALGPCGCEVCCSRFIEKFHGVSVKMAKDQDLSLKPIKVSGMCGRLKCCMAYEYDLYQEASKNIPLRGSRVECDGQCGVVQDVNVLKQKVTVLTEDGVVFVVPAHRVINLSGQQSFEQQMDAPQLNDDEDDGDIKLPEDDI